ncbi:MAG: glycosyltransferase [Gammaproteobacteria bacterium]
MQCFFGWFAKTLGGAGRPWLILGKGPSFSKLTEFDVSEYRTLSLNHAVRERKVDVAHIIDYDVVEHCGESLLQNAGVLVMPWHPHMQNKPSYKTLEMLVAGNRILERLDAEGRLLWYNLSTAKSHRSDAPVVRVKYFSAEAALNLLATAGVRHMRSLGVDGGAAYSTAFDDLKEKTLLANSRTSFDDQFREIARTIQTTGIDYAPLDIESPIRVFVAVAEAQMLAVKVLEYSIKKHTSMSATVFPMHLSDIEIPVPRDPKKQPRTPFSFQRFLIPQLMNWQGRAIYLDSDMQVFKDMRALWTLPFNGAQLLAAREPSETGRRPQFSVMLLDCSALDWRIEDIVSRLDDGSLSYEDLMYHMKVANGIQADIDPAWNSLERYKPGSTALVHYTDMNAQPWVSCRNKLGYLWVRDLFEAVDGGFISKSLIEDHVRCGWLRPSLLWQLKHRVEDTTTLPREARLLDRDFVAPFQSLPKHSATPWIDGKREMPGVPSQNDAEGWGKRLARSIRSRFS